MNQVPPGMLASPAAHGPRKSAAVAAVPAANPRIAGVIGAELSGPVHAIRRIVQILRDTSRCSVDEMAELLQAMDDAGKIARQSQQLARLAEGRMRQSHERVSLDQLLESALKERQAFFEAHRIDVKSSTKSVEIVVDPGLLSNLVETALDWAVQDSRQLVVALDINKWPEHGVMSIRSLLVERPPGSEVSTVGADSLSWYLLAQIAKTMGVTLKREDHRLEKTLILEFARTVKHLEGLTAMEIESSSGDSAFHTGTKALAGLRILLITKDVGVRGEVERACQALGLRTDTVTDSEKAARYTEREQPHMIIVDERLRDDVFDDLMQDIRRLDPNFGFLEVTDSANTFEVSSWMSDSITRVSRNALRQQLPSVLTLELAKAF